MDSRRIFVGRVATSLAGTIAVGPEVLGAADRIRVGIIGAGDRGMELAAQIRACSNMETVAIADVYRTRLDSAVRSVSGAKGYTDYRSMLDDRSIDAVVIATPPHLHTSQFCDALSAGKHVYVERTMAFTVAGAKKMRDAYARDGGKRVVQVGHQAPSTGHAADVRQFLADPAKLGRVTAISMQMHRNTPVTKAQWSRKALMTSDLTADNVAWEEFLGDASKIPFDANRFIHWRYFWDYSGGNVFEGMSQQLAFWYKALKLGIPRSASMDGGVYLWKDGREVPDTMHVTLDQPDDILVAWTSSFGNMHLGVSEEVLGTHGTISRASQLRYAPQKVNVPDGGEMIGRATHTPHAHMQNFADSIRLSREPNSSFDLGYRVSIACRMAVDSYRQGRKLHWDPVREEIV